MTQVDKQGEEQQNTPRIDLMALQKDHISHGRKWVFCIVMAFITTLGLSEAIRATENTFPFAPGEKLTVHVRWGVIKAAEAVFEVLPIEVVDGSKAYHFVMTAKTTRFVDLFYKLRDRIDAYADVEMTHSILYRKQKRARKKKDIVIDFNWDKNEAQYSESGEKKEPISILPGSFDPLSVFYAFRLHDLQENAQIERPVTDGKKCVIGRANVLKREKVEVAGKIYDTYLVEPDLQHIKGVFEKSKRAKLQIWFTADELRLPVKIRSKVTVGSFVGELVSTTGLRQQTH